MQLRGLMCAVVALGLAACVEDNESPSGEGGAGGAEIDAGAGGVGGEGAAGGEGGVGGEGAAGGEGGIGGEGAAGGEGGIGGEGGVGGEGGAGPDACERACVRFTDCSIDLCEGFGPDDRAGLAADCDEACAGNPAFATVINGSANCDTVVEFGRDTGDPDYNMACGAGGGEPEPLVPDGTQCPYPCVGDEICNQGQCVRPDGTCETNYHCRFGTELCQDGTCVTEQFAECRAEADCTADGQACRSFSQNPLDPGICLYTCEDDDICPVNEICNAQAGNVCYYEFCGPGSPNGDVYGTCRLGDWDGICYPLPEGQRNAQGVPGLCLEADGDVELGGECDAQSQGRDPESRATQCSAGGICFGDNDDPREPGAVLDDTGICTTLCDPRQDDACREGTICLDFTNQDDPNTPDFDDTRYIGACIASDCDVFGADECGDGEGCRVFAATSTAGQCAPVAGAADWAPCETGEDCSGNAICVQDGANPGLVCLPLCQIDAENACGEGRICFADEGWAIGICYTNPEGEPGEPEMPPEEPEAPPE